MTTAEWKAQYDDNAGYDLGSGGVASCRLFIEACRVLARLSAVRAEHGGERVDLNVGNYERQQQKAEEWLAANDTDAANGAARVTTADFRSFRG